MASDGRIASRHKPKVSVVRADQVAAGRQPDGVRAKPTPAELGGDLAPLDRICTLAERHNAMVCVDDSHATGFIGRTGRGTHEQFGVMGKIDVITTRLGKALGGASGGCVSGRSELVELCRQRARPYLFSNTVAPPIVAGGGDQAAEAVGAGAVDAVGAAAGGVASRPITAGSAGRRRRRVSSCSLDPVQASSSSTRVASA